MNVIFIFGICADFDTVILLKKVFGLIDMPIGSNNEFFILPKLLVYHMTASLFKSSLVNVITTSELVTKIEV